MDSLENDPRNKAFYLKQIPVTEEQLQASHQLLSDALLVAGVLEHEKLGNYPLARKTLTRLVEDYPEHEKMNDAYYHLFLVCGRMGLEDESLGYKNLVIEKYPESSYAQLLSNPKYEMIARGGRHLEDSVYAETYASYLKQDYEAVKANYAFSTENYPEGKHRARFMFVHAMSQLYSGDRDGFVASLKALIEKYSSEEVSKLASEIMKGVNEGRLLSEGQWNTSDIWSRRIMAEGDGPGGAADSLKDDRLGNFAFVLAYEKGSLNEDQLLYEVAKYNFTTFTARNFELEISDLGDISMLVVKGFISFDEVHTYAQRLYADKHMNQALEGIRSLLILEENLNMLGSKFSFEEYRQFYEDNFTPLQIPEELQLDETTIIRGEDEVDDEPATEDEEEEVEDASLEDDDFPFGF
jgi:hypothetical protein